MHSHFLGSSMVDFWLLKPLNWNYLKSYLENIVLVFQGEASHDIRGIHPFPGLHRLSKRDYIDDFLKVNLPKVERQRYTWRQFSAVWLLTEEHFKYQPHSGNDQTPVIDVKNLFSPWKPGNGQNYIVSRPESTTVHAEDVIYREVFHNKIQTLTRIFGCKMTNLSLIRLHLISILIITPNYCCSIRGHWDLLLKEFQNKTTNRSKQAQSVRPPKRLVGRCFTMFYSFGRAFTF